jgi:hypothetical protein
MEQELILSPPVTQTGYQFLSHRLDRRLSRWWQADIDPRRLGFSDVS